MSDSKYEVIDREQIGRLIAELALEKRRAEFYRERWTRAEEAAVKGNWNYEQVILLAEIEVKKSVANWESEQAKSE